jgi:hypothetical protein
MNRRHWIAFATATCCLAAAPAWASEGAIGAARQAAAQWLTLVDAGDTQASWVQAAGSFKSAVTVDQWTQASKAARGPLGPVTRRADPTGQYTQTLPGAPDDQYVLLQYPTTFEKKASSVETVTVQKDPDGQWRVAGYFIR